MSKITRIDERLEILARLSKGPGDMVTMSFRIPKDMKAKVEVIAKMKKVTVSKVLNEMIAMAMEKLAD